MKIFTVIITFAAIFISLNSESVKYSIWIRNANFSSETGSVILLNFTTIRSYTNYRTFVRINITKNINLKTIQVTINRCVHEKVLCEYFQKWKFSDPQLIKRLPEMKNEMWSPLFANTKPRLEFPLIKNHMYENENVLIDVNKAILFYPEVINYYYQIETILFDINNKKAAVVDSQISFQTFIERDIKRDPKNFTRRTSIKNT